jgi:hypothetical protein
MLLFWKLLMRQIIVKLFVGVILRPGFIHGTRRVGSVKIPLGLVGSPLQMVNSLSLSLFKIAIICHTYF